MDRRAVKNFLKKRSTIWTLSLCLTGAIVLGGIAAVNNSRNTADGEAETEIGQLAYLEEDVQDGIEDELFPTLNNEEEDPARTLGDETGDDAEDEERAYGSAEDADMTADENSEVSSDSIAADREGTDTESAGGTSGDGAAEAVSGAASDTDRYDAAEDDTATGADGAEEAASGNVIPEQTLLDAGVSFSGEDSLMWPSAGTILIDYSMDGTVYFETLDQYKYNPALIIGSETGNQVLASARGIVESVDVDEETGTTLVLNIGSGYRLTYGQLKELVVSEGDVLEAGDLIGYVSEPTKYYSKEGSNLYFGMTQDDTAVDPVLYLE